MFELLFLQAQEATTAPTTAPAFGEFRSALTFKANGARGFTAAQRLAAQETHANARALFETLRARYVSEGVSALSDICTLSGQPVDPVNDPFPSLEAKLEADKTAAENAVNNTEVKVNELENKGLTLLTELENGLSNFTGILGQLDLSTQTLVATLASVQR